jgi:outer membrane protein OmpA-like peptidoglycan-associated protein
MKTLLLTFIIAAALCVTEGFASGNETRKGNLELRKKNPSYEKALEHYQQAYSTNKEDAFLNYRIGYCYLNLTDKTKAIPYLEKAVAVDPKVSPDVRYLLGRAYQLNYEFDKAQKEFLHVKNIISTSDDKDLGVLMYALTDNGTSWKIGEESSKNMVNKLIDKKIEEARNGQIFKERSTNAKIHRLESINSEFPEYAPIIKADESELYFTSRRPDNTGGKLDRRDGQYFEDVYVSKKINGEWSKPEPLPAPVNTRTHNSALGLSADGQMMFLYEMTNGGDILVTYLKGDNWIQPVALPPTINSRNAERSVTISADKRRLFFERDIDGRSRDIYMSVMDKNGKWKPAVRLPKEINTEFDEDGIFFHPDGKTLYFSSKGHNTMGGYDIFRSELKEDGTWTEAENLGYPINTPDDDIFFILSADGKHGYYSSARNDGLGKTDIYMVDMPETIDKTKPVAAVTLLTGIVTDAQSNQPLDAKIQITDNASGEVIAELESNSKTGNYLIALPSGKNYGIAIDRDQYLFHSENFDLPAGQDYQKIEKNIALNKADVGAKIVLRNIFFDYDKSDLRDESKSELDRIAEQMQEFSTIKVELSGHTDNKGEDSYNKELSQKRAESVRQYLINKGVAADRLKAVGYGASKPVAENVRPDGSDNPDGRQQNRRTEFEVIGK